MDQQKQKQKRILLWATPRSMSTAFTRAMISRKSCKALNEPGVPAYYHGEERMCFVENLPHGIPPFWPQKLPIPNATFKDYYNILNGPYPGYAEVFAKELTFRYKAFLDAGTMDTIIPTDYVHTFLIRHPRKTLTSLYGLGYSFNGREDSYAELEQLYDWVTKTKGQKTIVIEADDLQANPERVLRRYCEFLGLEYEGAMVEWPPLPESEVPQFTAHGAAYTTARETTRFLARTPTPIVYKEGAELTEKAIRLAMPVYEKMMGHAEKFE